MSSVHQVSADSGLVPVLSLELLSQRLTAHSPAAAHMGIADPPRVVEERLQHWLVLAAGWLLAAKVPPLVGK